MTAIARMAMLDLRTVRPYRTQGLALFAVVVLIDIRSPVVIVPVLVLLVTSQIASYPFHVADKAGLETLYSVLPVPRRSVLYGHYAWALVSFLATATVGTALAVLIARVQSLPLAGATLVEILAVSWALFAVNVGVQFPLLIRFGYTQTSVLSTTLPLALVGVAVVRLHLSVTWLQTWYPLLWIVGVAAIVTSAVVARSADQRRVRYRTGERDHRTGRDQ